MTKDSTGKPAMTENELTALLKNATAQDVSAFILGNRVNCEAALIWLARNAPAVLAELALGDAEPGVRLAAAERLTDQSVLSAIALWEYNAEVRTAAEARLTDKDALEKLAKRRAAHPDMAVDVFKQKNADIGNAERKVHHSGADSIFYTDSYLWDCNLAADIYCYYNGGNDDYFTTEEVTAYRGADMDETLWDFESKGYSDGAAIDKRCKYAAVSESGHIYIVEAKPETYRSYPGDSFVMSPADWPALNHFDTEFNGDLAFDGNDRLRVREYDFGYILDLDTKRVYDDQYILYDHLGDPEKLADVALHSAHPGLRWIAMQSLSDQALLARILKTDGDCRVRRGAAFCLTDQAALMQAAAQDEDSSVQKAAKLRLEALGQKK